MRQGPISGVYHSDSGITTYTCGAIGYQIGGGKKLQVIKSSDRQKIGPGTSGLERLVNGPNQHWLFLIEIARYLQVAKATLVR